MGKLCDCCSQTIPVWDDHLMCVKCRFAAGICTLDTNNPCSICESWSTCPWDKLRKSLRDARQKAVYRGTHHWTCNFPAFSSWMDSASTSSERISETGSLADLDIKDVDLVSAIVKAHWQATEVSVHQGPAEVTSAIDAGPTPTIG